MSPIGKKKCSYSPMQKKGLISPITLKTKYYASEGGEDTKVTVTKTPTATGYNEETKKVKTIIPFANKPKVSMEQAYENRDMNTYGNLSFPEFQAEAIKQSKPKVTTNVSNRVVENTKPVPPPEPVIDYSYLDGLAQTHGYKAGDGLMYGTQISSTVGSTLRDGKDPMSRQMTQLEADYLNKQAGKIIYGGPMSNLNKKKQNINPTKPTVNRVIKASF